MGLKVLDDDLTIIQIIANELAIGVERSVEGFRQQRIAERQSVRRQVSTTNVGDSGTLSQVARRGGSTTRTPAKRVRIIDLCGELESAS